MLTGILITDNGAHSPEDWSYASASMLLEALKIDPNSPRRTQLEMAKDRVRPQIAQILLAHHNAVQAKEREILADGQHDRLMAPNIADEHTDVDQAVADIHALLVPIVNSSLLFQAGEISNDPQAIDAHLTLLIRERIEVDLRTTTHIERSLHADKHAPMGDIHAIAFKAAFHSSVPKDIPIIGRGE